MNTEKFRPAIANIDRAIRFLFERAVTDPQVEEIREKLDECRRRLARLQG